jgi:hypothetical protein
MLLNNINPVKKTFLNRLPLVILVLGISLRLREYLNNRSLSFDEALLALNIINRGFRGLLRPLDNSQGAPLGFLFVEKAFVKLFGNSEFILRLFPFLCGIASLLLFYKLAKTYLKTEAFVLALSLFVISESAISYSVEVKQYSIDVFITILIFLISTYIYENELSPLLMFIYGITGCISVWFSHPSVFILAGAGVTLLISSFKHQRRGRFYQLLLITILWGLSFLIVYIISLHNLSTNTNLLGYWKNDLAPFPPKSFDDLLWFIDHFFNSFKDPLGFTLPGLAVIPFLLGGIHLYRRKRSFLLLLVSPFLFLLMASSLGIYPISGRLIFFLVPPVLLLVSDGAFSQGNDKNTLIETKLLGIILALLLLLYPLIDLRSMLISNHTMEDSRSAISYTKSHWIPKDLIYVYAGAAPTFQYYAPQFGFIPKNYMIGISARDDPGKYFQELSHLKDKKRVWILFSHVFNNEDKLILAYLDTQGVALDNVKYPGASVYLYNLDPTSK